MLLDPAAHRPAALPAGTPPMLAVVVDTEEEFDWSRPLSRDNTAVTTVAAQPRAHEAVFDRLGVVPTYVVDWPVATDPAAAAVLRDLADDGKAVIGTHLHPWVNPPHDEPVTPPTSYHGNLPEALEREKLSRLTDAITGAFGRRPTVFRAGRYGVGPHTAATLARLGYTVDTSIVPCTRFTADGGPDFRGLSARPSWVETGHGHLLELPVSCGYAGHLRGQGRWLYERVTGPRGMKLHVPGVLARSGLLERIRLTPEGAGVAELVRLTRALAADGVRVFTLSYHSPSMAPGHTPYVRDGADLTAFLATIADFCTWFRDDLGGVFRTPEEIHALCAEAAPATAPARPAPRPAAALSAG